MKEIGFAEVKEKSLTSVGFEPTTSGVDHQHSNRGQTGASRGNGPFAASGHMVHAGGQAAHWDIQNKENSNLS